MLHGEELRQTLRQICAVPMPPPHEPVTMKRALAPPDVTAQSRGAAFRAAMAEAAKRSMELAMAKRPAGCITFLELVARSEFNSAFPVRKRLKEAGITRVSKTNQFAWYSVAALKKAGIITALLLALLPGVAGATDATVPGPMLCGQAAEIRKEAKAKFGEVTNGIGVTANNNLVELLFDQRDQSWTLIRVMPGGMACIIGTGEHWEHGPIGEPS